MRFAVGLVLVAACARKPAPPPANAAPSTVTKPDREAEHAAAVHRGARPATATRSRDRRIAAADPRVQPPTAKLTPEVVLATIRDRYIMGVERCYRRHLKRDSGARGRVLVSFTVDPRGRARDGDARGVTRRVDSCIAAQVARWRFPVARGHADAHFALGLELGAE